MAWNKEENEETEELHRWFDETIKDIFKQKKPTEKQKSRYEPFLMEAHEGLREIDEKIALLRHSLGNRAIDLKSTVILQHLVMLRSSLEADLTLRVQYEKTASLMCIISQRIETKISNLKIWMVSLFLFLIGAVFFVK